MDNNFNVLVVVDNDLAYAIEHGFYSDLKSVPGCKIMSVDEFYKQKINAPMPLLDGKDIYIRNPYTKNSFIPIEAENVEIDMINNRAFAIREALIMMGAKDIILREDISDDSESKTNAGANGGVKGVASGKVDVEILKKISLDIKSVIESHDASRQPKPAEEVKEFLRTHNLSNDTNLCLLAERFEREGRFTGTEKVQVSFGSEMESALRTLSNLNHKVFNADLNFESKQKNLHKITKSLEVNFG